MSKMLKIKPFQETLSSSMCGPASLKIVLDYYGINKTEAELAVLTENNKELGTTAEKIKIAAEKLSFKVVIKNKCEFTDVEEWLNRDVPVIVDWFTAGRDDYPNDIISADGHYSVVCGLGSGHIYLQDPEIGKVRKMQRAVFKRVWFDFSGEFIEPAGLIVRQIIAIYK